MVLLPNLKQMQNFFSCKLWVGNQRERKQAGTSKISTFVLVPEITTRNTEAVEDITKLLQHYLSNCIVRKINIQGQVCPHTQGPFLLQTN